jgi:hypothetical protein
MPKDDRNEKPAETPEEAIALARKVLADKDSSPKLKKLAKDLLRAAGVKETDEAVAKAYAIHTQEMHIARRMQHGSGLEEHTAAQIEAFRK